jgi:hypothetical protein
MRIRRNSSRAMRIRRNSSRAMRISAQFVAGDAYSAQFVAGDPWVAPTGVLRRVSLLLAAGECDAPLRDDITPQRSA